MLGLAVLLTDQIKLEHPKVISDGCLHLLS